MTDRQPPEMRVSGAQSRPVAGSDCLNTPPRSAERAALDVARGTLIGIRAGLPKEWERSRALIDKALADIDTLCPPVKR